MRVPFVDAHIHLWQLDHLHYPWLMPPFADDGPNGSVEAIARHYSPTDYLADMDGWNLVGSVHVDAGADAVHALEETEWLEGLAAEHGVPTGIVAFAPLHDPAVGELLAKQAAHPRVRGIRHIVNWHPDARRSYTPQDWTRDEQWQAGFALLAQHRLRFDLQCYPGQMPALAEVIARNPDVPVIINHMGMPVVTDADGFADWRIGMAALAALPQVAVKLSGLGFIRRDWTPDLVRPLVLETIELFGTDRCMFASDTPTDKLFAPIATYLEFYESIADTMGDDERRALWGRNANRIYGLGLQL
ncbi:amidohydrolase family protein [Croceibacterium sp. TMG7-5b_MA50]|uniref:amidohydrolase family protein n=1 Tax=Croceibacterium sp. TMG7-5b_MA50 TaxID=3121290 RepID=UPI003221A7E0